MMDSYNVEDDVMFKDYLSEGLSDESIRRYSRELNKFCKFINMSFKDFIDECKGEQDIVLEEEISVKNSEGKKVTKKKVTHYDVDSIDSFIKKSLEGYVDYCKDRGNMNSTINDGMIVLRTFLAFHNLKLPKWKPLPNDRQDWALLEKEDFNFIMNDSSLVHQSLITFMLSSGIRIGDFMEATAEYHDYVDVEEFIDNAPEDMIGYWNFNPNKTKRFGIRCKTFNSAESSNYILQNLRRIKNEYLPRKSYRIKEELKISKDYALFGSHHGRYKEHILVRSITDQFTLKNKKLHDWRVGKIKKAISEGIMAEEDFEKEVANIPKFHAHACRKYFISIISKNCGDLRLCTLMEGHANPVKTDSSYVKKDKEDVKGAYLLALDDLTLAKVETRIYTNKITEEIHKELDDKNKKIDELESLVKKLKDDKGIKTDSEIKKMVYRYFNINFQEKPDISDNEKVLCVYASEIAIDDGSKFDDSSEEYMDSLFKRAEALKLLNADKFDEKLSEYNIRTELSYITADFNMAVNYVITQIMTNKNVRELVNNKQKMLKFKIIDYLEEYDCKTQDDVTDEILRDVSSKAISDVV